MHSAPAVRYPVPRSTRAGGALALLCLLAAGVCLGWWVAAEASAAAGWAVAAGLALGVAVAGVQWRGMRPGELHWDGQAWWWLSDGAPGLDEQPVAVDVRLDLQTGVLIHLANASGLVRWRYLERRAQPQRWSDLRRALYGPSVRPVQA